MVCVDSESRLNYTAHSVFLSRSRARMMRDTLAVEHKLFCVFYIATNNTPCWCCHFTLSQPMYFAFSLPRTHPTSSRLLYAALISKLKIDTHTIRLSDLRSDMNIAITYFNKSAVKHDEFSLPFILSRTQHSSSSLSRGTFFLSLSIASERASLWLSFSHSLGWV